METKQKFLLPTYTDARYVHLYLLPDNNLLMVLTAAGKRRLSDLKEVQDISQDDLSLELLEPLWTNGIDCTYDAGLFGQMSGAPAITNSEDWYPCDIPDIPATPSYFWYYEQYATKWWVDELEKNGYFVWTYFNAEPDEDEQLSQQ